MRDQEEEEKEGQQVIEISQILLGKNKVTILDWFLEIYWYTFLIIEPTVLVPSFGDVGSIVGCRKDKWK